MRKLGQGGVASNWKLQSYGIPPVLQFGCSKKDTESNQHLFYGCPLANEVWAYYSKFLESPPFVLINGNKIALAGGHISKTQIRFTLLLL